MGVTAWLHYGVQGIWVAEDLLGTSQETNFRGYRCAIRWPSDALDFELARGNLRATKGSATSGGDRWVEVRIARLEVHGLSSDITAQEFETQRHLPDNDVIPEMQRVALEASDVGDNFMADLVQRIRVLAGQFWLGASSHRPPQIWITRFFDSHGNDIRMGGVQQPPLELIAGKPILSLNSASINEALAHLSAGHAISIPDSLIQEARYMLWASEHSDPTMATFLAALAVESKAHETLRAVATDGQQALVEYVLDNPRDVTVSAPNLLDKFMKSICGRSLREERKDSFNRFLALITIRNKIAHRGHRITRDEASASVEAASEVFEWLTTVAGHRATPLAARAARVTQSIITDLASRLPNT